MTELMFVTEQLNKLTFVIVQNKIVLKSTGFADKVGGYELGDTGRTNGICDFFDKNL